MEKTSTSNTFEYTDEIQAKIVALLLVDPTSLGDALKPIQAKFFDNSIDQRIVGIILKYINTYAQPISIDVLDEEFQRVIKDPRVPVEDYKSRFDRILAEAQAEDFAYVRDQVRGFCLYQSTKSSLVASVDLLKTREYDEIVKRVVEARLVDVDGEGLEIVSLANVEPTDPEWFWQDRFFKGELNLLVGLSWTGKSYFTTWLASCVTTGRQFPETFWPTPTGRVLFLSCEDTKERITRRLVNCGGDKTRAEVIRGRKDGGMFSLATDIPILRAALKKRPDTVMLVVDPVSAYFGLGKADTNKGSDVRAILDPLGKLAQEFKITVIGVMHLNKSSDVSPLQRISGASAFGEVARSVWLIEKDRSNKDIKFFTPMKLSDGREPTALTWKINDKGAVEFIQSQIPPPVDEQLAVRPKQRTKKELAQEFLRETLKTGPKLAEEVVGMAENEGINKYTLEAAKREMGIVSNRQVDEKGNYLESPWEWSLPQLAS